MLYLLVLFIYFLLISLINIVIFIQLQATQIDNPDKYALSTIVVSREEDWIVEPTAGKRNF